MKSIGIDIGSSSVKVVEVQSTSRGIQVVQFHEHTLRASGNQSDTELEVIEFLRELSALYDPAQTRFIFALRQDRVAVRNKFFPFNDRLKIAKSLVFELEEDLPFSGDNAIFDAKIIRTLGHGADVLACATPKTHVEHMLNLAQDSNMDPFVLTAEGLAFANLLEKWNEPPPSLNAPPPALDEAQRPVRHVQLVLNMGHTHTLVSAYEGSSLIGLRTILWGGKNIAEAISKKYELPYYDALRELQTKAFILTNKQGATFDQVTFSETIAKSVREMVRDLQLSILEIRSEFNAQIHGISMTGGTSQIQNLGPFLTQMLEVPVNRFSALDHVPNVSFDKSPENGAKLGVAIALAIEGFKKPRNPAINFMRGDFAKENHYLKALWAKWGATTKVVAAAVVVLFVYTSLRDQFAGNLADRAQEVLKTQAKNVAKLSAKNATDAGIRKYIRDNKKRASELKTLAGLSGMNSAMDVLKRVNDAAPPKSSVTLDVRGFQVQDSQVTIQGYVSGPQQATVLEQALANVSVDGKVKKLPSALTPIAGRTAFSFLFNVDRGIQKATR